MDFQRRLRGKRKLAILVVGIVVVGMLALAYYDSEGRKADAANSVAVAVTAPLTEAQEQALRDQFTRYAPKDNRAPVTLTVYVMEGTQAAGKFQEAADAMNEGFPNLYLVQGDLRKEFAGLVPLESLSEKFPGDQAVTDSTFYTVAGTEFWSVPELAGMPECYLALQKADTYAVTKDAQTQLYYAYQAELLENIAGNMPVAAN